jgi:hypothetical protein
MNPAILANSTKGVYGIKNDLKVTGAVQLFSGGYYNLEIPMLDWAQHTYVVVDIMNDIIKFPCYGDVDTEHLLEGSVYPALLYKPQILPPYTDYGTKLNGDLWLARAIACGDPSEDPRCTYDRKSGGSYLFGDCCGIVYAINGVCHHMEARILWACERSPIVWPPSATASFWVWFDVLKATGFYGNNWNAFKLVFDAWRNRQLVKVSIDEINDLKKITKETIMNFDEDNFRAAMSFLFSDQSIGITKQSVLDAIPDKMVVFLTFKNDLDIQLLRGMIKKQDYAELLDKKFKDTMLELANVLDETSFLKMFGVKAGSTPGIGINPELIPDNCADLKIMD